MNPNNSRGSRYPDRSVEISRSSKTNKIVQLPMGRKKRYDDTDSSCDSSTTDSRSPSVSPERHPNYFEDLFRNESPTWKDY